MKRTHSGAASGKGAVYEWEGNSKVGKGRMEIVDTSPPSKVTVKLDFLKPFEGHNVAEFTLEPKGDSTNVTWAMHGPAPYISKLMAVFVSMDSMVGKDFEAGLANMKAAAEKPDRRDQRRDRAAHQCADLIARQHPRRSESRDSRPPRVARRWRAAPRRR